MYTLKINFITSHTALNTSIKQTEVGPGYIKSCYTFSYPSVTPEFSFESIKYAIETVKSIFADAIDINIEISK